MSALKPKSPDHVLDNIFLTLGMFSFLTVLQIGMDIMISLNSDARQKIDSNHIFFFSSILTVLVMMAFYDGRRRHSKPEG